MPPVAFLVKTFPKLSETFILEEILGLERMQVPLALFALSMPRDTVRHDAVARVRAPLHYLPEGAGAGVLRLHLRALLRHPVRYLRTLAFCAMRREGFSGVDLTRGVALGLAIERAGIRHIHAHFASEPAAAAEIAARLTGARYSISAHAKDIYVGAAAVLRRKLDGARFALTCTGHNLRHLDSLHAGCEEVHLMYHGIDSARFRATPRTADTAAPLILAVGRLRAKKGFDTLVRACALLRDAGRAFRCEIVGYGEEREPLQALIEELGLVASVRLAGTMNHAALRERYQAASIFAAPCRITQDGDRDGIPNVLLEAMAMELAVVSTPVSGIPEVVVDGSNGALVPQEDPVALAAALEKLIAQPHTRAAMGARARELVLERFDNDRNLRTLCDLLSGARPSEALDARTEVQHA